MEACNLSSVVVTEISYRVRCRLCVYGFRVNELCLVTSHTQIIFFPNVGLYPYSKFLYYLWIQLAEPKHCAVNLLYISGTDDLPSNGAIHGNRGCEERGGVPENSISF